MAGKREEQMKEITDRLEQGVKDLFTSEKYTEYLKTMAQFHNYSFNNTLLIATQKPEATLVAGFSAWKKKFNRQVKRGEKGIKIIAPAPIRTKEEVEKFDPETNEPVLRWDGQPETEEVEHIIPRFRVATVFDISQTYGDPLPELDTPELMGSVENFGIFMGAIEMASPAPMRYAGIDGDSKGYYSNASKEIVIREGMSEKQTMKTAVHEVTHAMCHDRDVMEELGEKKNQMTREVEAESVAYTVCSYFGMDTSDYSFPYIAGWSSDMDMKELRESMDFVRKTAGSFIDSMVENIQKLQRERPDKEHLEGDDLILKVVFPLTDNYTYLAVENKERKELLAQLKSYHELYGQGNEMTVETFLEGQGIIPIPWYDSAGLMVEHPVDFFDFEYTYEAGIVDALELPAIQRAELLINRAEYGETVFNMQDKNLIVNYAFKIGNLEDTRALIRELAEALESSDMRAAQEIRDNAQDEIDSLPDGMVGISEMHEFGCHNDSVLPLTMGRAVELHHAGLRIYSLKEDGSSILMNTELDILEAGGMFGVDARAWEGYHVMASVGEENKGREMQAKDMPGNGILQEPEADGAVEEYEEVEIFEVPVLFSDGRIAEDEVPEGLYRYDLRGSDHDPGDPVTVENKAAVNHAGTILSAHPLPIPERGYLTLGEELNFTGGMARAGRFLQSAQALNMAFIEERMQDAVIRANEEILYLDSADRYAIFQINEDGKGREYLFMDSEYINSHGMEVQGEDYSLVYGGSLEPGNGLDAIYERFNLNHPEGYAGHSLSVSDVVVMSRGGEAAAYFVDDIGFTDLPDFIRQRERVLEEEARRQIPEEEMYPPLYTHTITYAMEHGRADDYLESRKLNLDCKKAVEDAIRENFDGMYLKINVAVGVLEEYGAERVAFILANTIQHLEHDGRFSDGNKAWAKGYVIPENINRGMDMNADYVVSSHPAVLDGFIRLARDWMLEHGVGKETKMQIDERTKGFIADGHFGTWHTAEAKEISGELFYRMEHEEYGDSVASIVVNQEGELVAEDLEHGFDQGAMEAIGEYFSEKGIEMEPEPEPEQPFIAQYYVIQNTDGDKAEREYQYFEEMDAAVDAYHQIPNHMDKQLGMESSEQPPSRMSLIECRNGIETLTDIEFNSLSGKWVREETMEASQKAREYLDNYDTEIAYQTGKGYFSIQTVSDGYDYTIYGKDFREIDGGVYDNPDISIGEAMEEIISDEGISITACKVMDYEELQERAEMAAQEDLRKAKETEKGKQPPVSDMTEPEPALNGQSRAGIEETVLCYAQAQIDGMGLSEEVELLGARVYGSRSREGLYHEGSDIDVVVSYSGDLQEDVFFNALHEGGLKIAGIPVDINPISMEKTGTLEEYLKSAEEYLDGKERQGLTGDIVKFSMDHDEDLLGFWDGAARIETEPVYQAYEIIGNALERNDTEKFRAHLAEVIETGDKESQIVRDAIGLMEKLTGESHDISVGQEAAITFYVAECTEFPVLGEYHERLETLQEAMELYEKIPAERMNGIKGIGFSLEDGSIYDGNFDLMVMGEMQTEFINEIPQYRDSPLVQKAIADMEVILLERRPEREVSESVEKAEKPQQPMPEVKKEEKAVQTAENRNPDTVAQESGRDPAGLEKQSAEPEKAAENAPKAGRGISGGNKKQSVLNALRERQARMKAQEKEKPGQEKQGQKAQAKRKGEPEL